LFHIDAREELLPYAREWLCKFPCDEYAPDVVAHWLENFQSPESIELAAKYLKANEDPEWIFRIICVAVSRRPCLSLESLVSDLIDKYPRHYIWGVSLCRWREEPGENLKALTLKWLRLNKANPDLDVTIQAGMPFSIEITEEVFQWMRTAGLRGRHMPRALEFLVTGINSEQKELLQRVVEFAREWVRCNPTYERAAHIHRSIVATRLDPDDVIAATAWYKKHHLSRDSWAVLPTLLSCAGGGDHKIDEFIVKQAKRHVVLTDDPPKSLVLSVLRNFPDELIVERARELGYSDS
jgi:hypothetical protein